MVVTDSHYYVKIYVFYSLVRLSYPRVHVQTMFGHELLKLTLNVFRVYFRIHLIVYT